MATRAQDRVLRQHRNARTPNWATRSFPSVQSPVFTAALPGDENMNDQKSDALLLPWIKQGLRLMLVAATYGFAAALALVVASAAILSVVVAVERAVLHCTTC